MNKNFNPENVKEKLPEIMEEILKWRTLNNEEKKEYIKEAKDDCPCLFGGVLVGISIAAAVLSDNEISKKKRATLLAAMKDIAKFEEEMYRKETLLSSKEL